jgi:tetratricopeptide (TPR) repeat protein
VAEFYEVDTTGKYARTNDAYVYSNSTYEQLEKELSQLEESLNSENENVILQVRSPEEIGPVRTENVGQLADRHNADVVLYGVLKQEQGRTFFYPEVYLRPKLLASAYELTGSHQLGFISGNIGENIFKKGNFSSQITSRAQVFAYFVIGLNHFFNEKYEAASSFFTQALNLEGWSDDSGKEILFLFLGNISGKLEDLSAAEFYYNESLKINPEYSRAQLGLVEVRYMRAVENCEAGSARVKEIRNAIRLYRQVLEAKDQPENADIQTKVDYRVGRAYTCLTQALAGDYSLLAEESLRRVIYEFEENGNQRVAYHAAEAYSNLGFLALPYEGDSDSGDAYREALQHYSRAMEISDSNERKGHYASMIDFINARLGELDSANRAKYQQELDQLSDQDLVHQDIDEPNMKVKP